VLTASAPFRRCGRSTSASGDRGVTVVACTRPSSRIERDTANVRRALRDQRIAYPVAFDGDGAIWDAFGVQAWPTSSSWTAHGRIRAPRGRAARRDAGLG